MALKQVPMETNGNGQHFQGKKQKHFNPGNKIKKKSDGATGTLKNICLKLIHFINRGSRFTYEQIDELIMAMQRTILNLQKRKQEIIKRKRIS